MSSIPANDVTGADVTGDLRRTGFVFLLGAVLSVWHVYANTLGTLPELWTSAIHFAGFGALAALMLTKAHALTRWTLAVLVVASGLYIIVGEQPLYDRGMDFVLLDWIFAGLAVLLAIELVRRTTGWIIPVFIIIALTYTFFWGKYLPGVLHFPGLSVETVLYRSYFGSDGMFGSIARISSTFVFMFILFGAFLIRSGAGDFVIGMAEAAAGRLKGGPGFVAVIGSALTGTVTGSAVANTVSTGVITIPMMIRAGFPPRMAAGIEAAASTGGQLMPPIMGAGAFVMASYTELPYLHIVAVSILPALLYFLTIGYFVALAARRLDIGDLGSEERPPLGQVLRQQGPTFLIPMTLLIVLLMNGFTPTYAAGWAIVAVIAASWLTPRRMGPRAILDALVLGARNMAGTAVLLIAIGLVVNVVVVTGIGPVFSLMINDWAFGSLVLALALLAMASLVLGMGLPVTASYIVLATLSAPALYAMIADIALQQVLMAGTLGQQAIGLVQTTLPDMASQLAGPMTVDAAQALIAALPPDILSLVIEQGLPAGVVTGALLSAHMIIFWLSQASNVTPPVCLVAYAAAGIAKTPPVSTGVAAWKIAKGPYILPLLFAFTPILSGDWWAALEVAAFATLGSFLLVAAFEAWLLRPMPHWLRLLAAANGLVLLWPHELAVNLAALAVAALLVVLNLRFPAAAYSNRSV